MQMQMLFWEFPHVPIESQSWSGPIGRIRCGRRKPTHAAFSVKSLPHFSRCVCTTGPTAIMFMAITLLSSRRLQIQFSSVADAVPRFPWSPTYPAAARTVSPSRQIELHPATRLKLYAFWGAAMMQCAGVGSQEPEVVRICLPCSQR
jgi:hypothetical protein